LREQFVFKNLSPERGQISEALASYNVNASQISLDSAQLTGVNLEGVLVHAALLNGADLDGANLQGADFSFSQFYRASFIRAKMFGATMVAANFTGADFSYAEFSNNEFSNNEFNQSIFVDANIPGARFTNDALDKSLKGVWARRDILPTNYPYSLVLCDFNSEIDFRNRRPSECKIRENINESDEAG